MVDQVVPPLLQAAHEAGEPPPRPGHLCLGFAEQGGQGAEPLSGHNGFSQDQTTTTRYACAKP